MTSGLGLDVGPPASAIALASARPPMSPPASGVNRPAPTEEETAA
jgi:hypothetical protein